MQTWTSVQTSSPPSIAASGTSCESKTISQPLYTPKLLSSRPATNASMTTRLFGIGMQTFSGPQEKDLCVVSEICHNLLQDVKQLLHMETLSGPQGQDFHPIKS